MSTVPSGTVTFLLTDVEGSTPLWSAEPARMTIAISRHYEILDSAVSAHGGVRPVEQGEGDSIVAAFARPSDAFAAAVEAQLLLLAELDWLPVRMAVHTGEAILRGADNYVGPSIIACARIRAAAHGGQILISGATAALLGDTVALIDLGAVRLKGIVAPEHVWQVTGPGLPDDFPPLRGLDSAPHNLPPALTSFIGRQAELDAVRAAVARGRLTTLTGAGGCGKTRLALAVVTESVDRYVGGSWWIELATTSTDDQVANAVAVVLRIPLVGGVDQVDQVAHHLGQIGPAMLVLDNAEHVLEAVARLVAAVIERCPDVHVVVTSREPLGLANEGVWRTPSFAPIEAAALFIERASSVRDDLDLDGPLVDAICRRLDGIPLAIELAAARARSLPLDRIAAELSQVFRILTGGSRTAVARQQTLLASIAWSYDLLSAVEQAVLRRLSVFHAPFRLDTAEHVVADDVTVIGRDVLDVIGHLVDKSLVQFDPSQGRYRLLETVRQFCTDRLTEFGEVEATRNRHAAFYGAYARQVANRMRGLLLRDDLWLDLPDVFAALRWAYDSSPVDAYRICAMNRTARFAVGYLDELAEQLEWLVARDGREAPADWAAAMVHLTQEAITLFGRVDLLPRLPDYESSIDPEDADTLFWHQYSKGFTGLFTGDKSGLAAAVAVGQTADNPTWIVAAASMLAIVAAFTGRLETAEAALANVHAVLRDLNQPMTCDSTWSGHAAAMWVAGHRGRLDEAKSLVGSQVPKNAFTLFLSALPTAWLGFVAGDEICHETARRWLDRTAPPIQSGAASYAALVREPSTSDVADRARVRAWIEFCIQVVPSSAAALVMPLIAASCATGDLAVVEAMAQDLRRCSVGLGEPPLHLAVGHEISAMLHVAKGNMLEAGTAAIELIKIATSEGYVLMQIDGIEILVLSDIIAAETGAQVLAAAQTARAGLGYCGRWPNLGVAVLEMIDRIRSELPLAFQHGTTMSLTAACELAVRTERQRS